MTKAEKLQAVFHLYMSEHGNIPARSRDIVAWGVDKGLVEAPRVDPLAVLAGQMSNALGQEYDVYKGHRYRVNHARRVRTPQGQQTTIWGIIGLAPDEHIVSSFGQRREHIVGEMAQLKTDTIVRNELMTGKAEPYNLRSDLTEDLAERGLFD